MTDRIEQSVKIRFFFQKQVYYQFFQILSYMIVSSKRQPDLKLKAIPSSSLSPKAKHDKSSIFLNQSPNIFGSHYNRPPTAQQKIDHPPNVFIRRVKTNSNRIIKSKTDHSGHNDTKYSGSGLNYYIRQDLAIKSKSIHRVNSAKSFVIRKKNPCCGKRTNTMLINCQVEFQSIKKNFMQQIDQNSRQLEKKFQTIPNIDKHQRMFQIYRQKTSQDNNPKQKMSEKLENTIISQNNDKRFTLELLQTKKSNNFGRNSRLNQQSNGYYQQRNHHQATSKQTNKQNYDQSREKCLKYDIQSSNLSPKCNKFPRKQDKLKSNKQFYKKQRLNSACRTIRVPWAQIQTVSNHPQCQKLKKTRAYFPNTNQLTYTQQIAQVFGAISIIPNEIKSSRNCAAQNQSLKNLCDELYIEGS